MVLVYPIVLVSSCCTAIERQLMLQSLVLITRIVILDILVLSFGLGFHFVALVTCSKLLFDFRGFGCNKKVIDLGI